jgi:transcriptional regulator with XRE-family HTH domain
MDFNTLALHIGSNIKAYRKKLGLSQSQACVKIACDKRFYQRIEAGKAGLTLRTLLKISLALGIPLYDLFKIEITHRTVEQEVQKDDF